MFGFDEPEDGSEERFRERLQKWTHRDVYTPIPEKPGWKTFGVEPYPWPKRAVRAATHHAWWIVHNCVSHPLIGLIPLKPFFKFHDWTSHKMHGSRG